MRNREKIDDLLFALFDDGVLYGQMAMIKSIQDLGLINGKMAEMINHVITCDITFDQHFSREYQEAKIKTAIEQLETLI